MTDNCTQTGRLVRVVWRGGSLGRGFCLTPASDAVRRIWRSARANAEVLEAVLGTLVLLPWTDGGVNSQCGQEELRLPRVRGDRLCPGW